MNWLVLSVALVGVGAPASADARSDLSEILQSRIDSFSRLSQPGSPNGVAPVASGYAALLPDSYSAFEALPVEITAVQDAPAAPSCASDPYHLIRGP